jgi:primary-amine oxidase
MWCVLCVCTTLLLAAGGCCCPRVTGQPSGAPVNQVIQAFNAGKPTQTAWKVTFAHATSRGLYITGAWFKRDPAEPWMRVLWDARLSDIFVPYHTGSPRFLDLSSFSFNLVPASKEDAGCCGSVIDGVVVKEVRDRGVAWKDDTRVYRGQELVLWSTLDAANYNYVIQYIFRDDGTIGFRLGATARNLPGAELEAHMHNGLWRVDVDLNGAGNDSALLMTHVETPPSATATDFMSPFNRGREGSAAWDDLRFTELAVQDTQRKNGKGNNIMYDLMPLRPGTPRHAENWARADFWVTRYRGTELSYTQLPNYVSNAESVTNTDVVLWYIAPMHHLPRDEDGEFVGGVWKGSALIMWSGFDLRPRNLFDRTPLFEP